MLDHDTAFPAQLQHRVPTRQQVLDQPASVNADRWQREVTERPIPAIGGAFQGGTGWLTITRADVFALGDLPINDDNAWQLLYASLAWGLGPKASRLNARLDALSGAAARVGGLLCDAWTAAPGSISTEDCYRTLLTDNGRPRIPWLGAAFATKFLYFAQGSHTSPSALILDAIVAQALRPHAWPASPTTAWWPSTYAAYCVLLQRWAAQATSTMGSQVAPDQIEYLLFTLRNDPDEEKV